MPQTSPTFNRFRPAAALPFLIVDARGRAIASFACESDAAYWRNRQFRDRGRIVHIQAAPHTYDPNDKSTDRRFTDDRRVLTPRRSGLDRRRPAVGARRA